MNLCDRPCQPLARHNSAAAARRGPRAKQSYERGDTNANDGVLTAGGVAGEHSKVEQQKMGCTRFNGGGSLVKFASRRHVLHNVQSGTTWVGQRELKLKKTAVITLRLRLKLPAVLP